jgi:hypothetical protein
MASPDPISLEGMDQIPDPAARALASAVPAARPPSERALTRADRRRRSQVAVVFAAVWLGAVAVVLGLRPDLGSAAVAAPIVAWMVGGAVILGAVLRPRARGLPAGVRAVQHAVWIVPAAYVAGAVLVAVPSEAPLTWASIRSCLALSTLMTLGPLAAAALFLRGSFLSAPGWRGAAVGALTGLAGSIGIHAHCSCQVIGHLLAAHGAAILIGAAAGAALGRLGGRP